MQYLAQSGGAGYFPLRMVREALREGRLHRVPQGPSFTLPAYMVFPLARSEGFVEQALEGLRLLGREERRRPGS